MHTYNTIARLLCLASVATALPASQDATAKHEYKVHKLHQFPLGYSPESLMFRPNGKLLMNTLAPSASTYQIDVTDGCVELVHNFPKINSSYGIAQIKPDHFYVAGGIINLQASTRQLGSFAVWELDMTHYDKTGHPKVTKISDFPKATLNGMWTLDAEAGLILIADTAQSVIYRLNVYTGKNEIVIDDPVLKYPVNGTVALGPNGLETRDGYCYVTNTGAGTFNRIPINARGEKIGPGEVLAQNPNNLPGGDDWVFDAAGNAYIGENPETWFSLVKNGSHTPEIIAGGPNSDVFGGPTCARFGVSKKDIARGRLYIGDNGGLAQYRSGNFTRGGALFYIDTAV